MQSTKEGKRPFLWLSLIFLVIVCDQTTKFLAVRFLKPIDTVPIISDVLHLTYATNKGAAFGMLKDHRWVFLTVSSVAIVCLIIYLFKTKFRHPLFYTAISFIIGGGIGNMIDRTVLGYVVDFIDFRLINFAIFNVADSFVCVGCALMFIWVIFFSDKKGCVLRTDTAEGDDTSTIFEKEASVYTEDKAQ